MDMGIEALIMLESMYPLEQEIHEDLGCIVVLDEARGTGVLILVISVAGDSMETRVELVMPEI